MVVAVNDQQFQKPSQNLHRDITDTYHWIRCIYKGFDTLPKATG